MQLQALKQMRQTGTRTIQDKWLSHPTRRFTDPLRNIYKCRLEWCDINFMNKWSSELHSHWRRDTLQNKIMPEEQPENSHECDMHKLRHSPFPWPRRFRRLSNRTTTRTINTTKRTAASEATTITIVEEFALVSLSPLLPSTLEEVSEEPVNGDNQISS